MNSSRPLWYLLVRISDVEDEVIFVNGVGTNANQFDVVIADRHDGITLHG